MKVATFNVNSINVRLPAVLQWLETHDPTVLALQETKVTDIAFPYDDLEDWHLEVHGQPTYNGVCLISSVAMSDVQKGLEDGVEDKQARLICAEVDGVHIINTYVPQGNKVGSDKFEYKLQWLRRFKEFIEDRFSPDDPLIWLGDINIAPDDMDVYAPEFFENDVSVTPDERAILQEILGFGFTDLYRHFHPDEEKAFTFFDYRVRDAVRYRKGWRIDHIYVTAPMLERAIACEIDMEPRMEEKASDHAPVWAEFEDA